MIKKRLEKFISCFMVGMMVTAFIESGTASAEENVTIQAKNRVSVHDPSIVKEGDTYYVFGSHIEAAKSTDLQNWTSFANGYTTPNNKLFGDLSGNLAGSFAWAGENDADSKGGFSVWAPNVIRNEQYVNDDGSKGAYMMYYCTSSTYKRSAIGYAVSQNIEGPYTYVDTIMYSGFSKNDSFDANSNINTNYENTNIKDLMDKGTITEANSKWFNADGSYNTSYAPNAIDPELFFDESGKLWMSYGSWSGGIYILEIDPETGATKYPGVDSNTDKPNLTDRYFGTRISGGFTRSGEGADIVYDKATGSYYLYVTYEWLGAMGGYNMRLFKSENPDGPYLDAAGNNAVLTGNVDNAYAGIKLISNYKLESNEFGYRAAGHNSSFIDSDGQMYLVYHTRFDNRGEYHEVRVHQMFVNEDGWPVVVPYENSGDKISATGYTVEEIVGNYQFINHGNSSSSAMQETLNVVLTEDNKITGDVNGTWTMKSGSYHMNIVIDGVTYKGVFFKQQDESLNDSKVMTFTAVGSNNQSIWGSKLDLNDSQAVEYVAKGLAGKIPSRTETNLSLPTVGSYDAQISWTSSNPSVIDASGIVKRATVDETVTLTAKITKGESVLNKTFDVVVSGKLEKLDVIPTFKYDFETLNEANEVVNSGSGTGNSILEGTASVIEDENRGKVLSITNVDGAVKTNYLALPSNTFDGITSAGYSVSMWVNLDKEDPNYFEHSALFEANGGGQNQYPVTRLGANLISRINANGAYSDADKLSKQLASDTWEHVTYTVSPTGIVVYVNGLEVGRQDKEISVCFDANFLANMKDVRVGSGNIWGDRDIAKAKFDNVAIFNTALTKQQVEALYNEDFAVEEPEVPAEPTPEIPGTPEVPAEPTPETPGTPEVPAEPTPETPGTPEVPAEPTPETPGTPEVPVEPIPETPVVTDPADEVEVTPETPNNTGDSVKVTEESGKKVISVSDIGDKDGNTVVNVADLDNGFKLTVEDIEAIKEGNGSVQIISGNTNIKLPFSIFNKNDLTEGARVEFTFSKSDDAEVTKKLKGLNKVFTFKLSIVNGDKVTPVTNFASGKVEITVTLSDEELKGLNKNKLGVFYYNEATNKFEYVESKVDGNKVTFSTSHFSKYVVAEKTTDSDGKTVLPETGAPISSAMIVVAALGSVAAGITLRRKSKDN